MSAPTTPPVIQYLAIVMPMSFAPAPDPNRWLPSYRVAPGRRVAVVASGFTPPDKAD